MVDGARCMGPVTRIGVLVILVVLAVGSIVVLVYSLMWPQVVPDVIPSKPYVPGDYSDIKEDLKAMRLLNYSRGELSGSVYKHASRFNPAASDVMIYLHIQKTGGTRFGRQLVRKLTKAGQERLCQRPARDDVKVHTCNRTANIHDVWLFARHSVGWPCGVHADYTELSKCAPSHLARKLSKHQRTRRKIKHLKFYWVTTLRDPIDRYISEWKHVQRGATWHGQRLRCNRKNYADKLESNVCWNQEPLQNASKTWTNVTLTAFLDCPYNLGANRQTRMLADLDKGNGKCHYDDILPRPNPTDESYGTYEAAMGRLLESAKHQLAKKFSFFTLLEHQRFSQYLFEHTFGMYFTKRLFQQKSTIASTVRNGGNGREQLSGEELERIKEVNRYDVELYEFAQRLFWERVRYFAGLEEAVAGE